MFAAVFFFQAEDGIRDLVRSRGLGDVYKRQLLSDYLRVRRALEFKLEGTEILLSQFLAYLHEHDADTITIEHALRFATAPAGASSRWHALRLSAIRCFTRWAAASDPRIHVTFHEQNGHISAASNTALSMAHGEFIALLDHDDELAEHALYHVALALNEKPALDLVYSDEDKIDAHGQRFGHYFKPDWNPDLFFNQNFIAHLCVYRLSLARAIGGFRLGYEGAQQWDFTLRFLEQTKPENIYHIARVLYHWRRVAGSVALSADAKPYTTAAGIKALEDHFAGRDGVVVGKGAVPNTCLLYTSPSPRDRTRSRMPSFA